MASEADNWQFFGLDLRPLLRTWRRGWEEARLWPAFAWLSPEVPVRAILPDGKESLRLGASADLAPDDAPVRAVAVVLPDSSVLIRRLVLPALTGRELRNALALEVAAASPFAPQNTAWGWHALRQGDRLFVRLAIAAQGHIEACIERVRERVTSMEPEVWADANAPIVLQGYGESVRAARTVRERKRILVAASAGIALVLALAATPVLQARQRLADAEARYATLQTETRDVVAAYEALSKARERARALQGHLRERPDVLQVIESLSSTLPEDAYLTRLEINGRKIRITGQADNASALMDTLNDRPAEFREVRAPFPISRSAGAAKESFTLEFTMADGGTTR